MINSYLIYDLHYVSQSLTPIPSNLIPYFAQSAITDSSGTVQITLNVKIMILRYI